MIDTTIPALRFQIYPGRDKLFRKRWYIRVVGKNNEVIFQSTQGYSRKIDATYICDRTRYNAVHASITTYTTDPRKSK